MKKQTTKLLSLMLVSVMLSTFLIGIVAAQVGSGASARAGATGATEGAVATAIDQVQQALRPVFIALFGKSDTGGQLLVQILAFLLVMFVVYGILDTFNMFGDKGWLHLLVGGIVAVIGIRFMPPNFLESLTTPSSALVALIFFGMPFLVVFFIGRKLENPYARRAMWVVYTVTIGALWIYNWSKYGAPPFNWIYIAFIFSGILAFAFDGVLQRLITEGKRGRTIVTTSNVQLDRIQAEIRDLEGALASATDPAEVKRLKKSISAKKTAMKNIKI